VQIKAIGQRRFAPAVRAGNRTCVVEEKVVDGAARDRQVRRLCFGLTFSIQATFNTQSGTKLLLRDPWCALPVTGFRRAPVQTLGLEKEDLVPL
jgi:hypothetical protein